MSKVSIDELLKKLPKSDKEIIQEAKTERLQELYNLISEELQTRSCQNENCDFEKERYGSCSCKEEKKIEIVTGDGKENDYVLRGILTDIPINEEAKKYLDDLYEKYGETTYTVSLKEGLSDIMKIANETPLEEKQFPRRKNYNDLQ